jgi:hypothetical protein
MKLRVFLSSTISDLSPVRQAIRETLSDMGHDPIMSEHGEVAYLPARNAEQSCYQALEQCDVLVAFIGRRYGSIGQDSKSVTQNEVRRAKELGIPVYCFLDRDVEAQLAILGQNTNFSATGFDNPVALLSFVTELRASAVNNALISYSSLEDAKAKLKAQLSGLLQSLLKSQNAVVLKTMGELVSEVQKLRYRMPADKVKESAAQYAVIKYFLDDLEEHTSTPRWHYKRNIISACRGMSEAAVPLVLAPSLKAFLESLGSKVSVMGFEQRRSMGYPGPHTGLVLAACNGPMFIGNSEPSFHYVLHNNLEFWVDERVLREFERIHYELKKTYTHLVRDVVTASA